MTRQQTIEDFLEALSSRQPTPGGGGASALAGAFAAALGLMVGNLTVGKKTYAAVEADVLLMMESLSALQTKLVALADEDARVFAPLAAAYKLPEKTQKEREKKERVMEEHLVNASLVPLQIMEAAVEVLKDCQELEKKGSVMAVSDVGVAAQFARAALAGAALNVSINVKSMKDQKKAGEINERAEKAVAEGIFLADSVYGNVLERLKGNQGA